MKVWVDCTAAAHPLVLRPVIEKLREAGHQVEITARDYGQTLGILDNLGLEYRAFGEHGGGSMAGKIRSGVGRSYTLARWARGRGFNVALGHGSVDIAFASKLLGIPSVQMQDYEFAGLQRQLAFRAARTVMVPDAISVEAMRKAGAAAKKLFRYPGLKEDYYLADFKPDPAVLDQLGIDRERVLAVVRPPPESSAYHHENPLYEAVIDRLAADPDTVAVVIPRTENQRRRLHERGDSSLIVPDHAVDGPALVAFADIVISAGGTMNREAVALGTPVFTIFSGRMGAVDEQLISDGRLRVLESADQLELVKRTTEAGPRNPRDAAPLAHEVIAAAKA